MKIVRYFVVIALAAAMLLSPMSGTVFAAGDDTAAPLQAGQPAGLNASKLNISLVNSTELAASAPLQPSFAELANSEVWAERHGHHGRGGYYGHGHHDGAAALFLGTAAAITGAAVLAYANRPDCDFYPYASGCGYGTKVVGTSLLAGGVAGIVIGAALWH